MSRLTLFLPLNAKFLLSLPFYLTLFAYFRYIKNDTFLLNFSFYTAEITLHVQDRGISMHEACKVWGRITPEVRGGRTLGEAVSGNTASSEKIL